MNRWQVGGAVAGGILGSLIAASLLAIVCGQPWGWIGLLPSVAATVTIIRWLDGSIARLDRLIAESPTHQEAGS